MDRHHEVREMRRAKAGLAIIRDLLSKSVTGEPRDIERVKRGSEGGRWKSADLRR